MNETEVERIFTSLFGLVPVRVAAQVAARLAVSDTELRNEVGRLRDGIRDHRDEHHRLDVEDNTITRELGRGDADLALWALLDREDSR